MSIIEIEIEANGNRIELTIKVAEDKQEGVNWAHWQASKVLNLESVASWSRNNDTNLGV